MPLKYRIALILKENKLKQKDLAALTGVSDGYISLILSGKTKNISSVLANLIEERLGYSAQWVKDGTEPKVKPQEEMPSGTEEHLRLIMMIKKLPQKNVNAVLAFIDFLNAENKFDDDFLDDDIIIEDVDVTEDDGSLDEASKLLHKKDAEKNG